MTDEYRLGMTPAANISISSAGRRRPGSEIRDLLNALSFRSGSVSAIDLALMLTRLWECLGKFPVTSSPGIPMMRVCVPGSPVTSRTSRTTSFVSSVRLKPVHESSCSQDDGTMNPPSPSFPGPQNWSSLVPVDWCWVLLPLICSMRRPTGRRLKTFFITKRRIRARKLPIPLQSIWERTTGCSQLG